LTNDSASLPFLSRLPKFVSYFSSRYLSNPTTDAIGKLLEESDLVKFGGMAAGTGYMRSMVEKANKLDTLEDERTPHVVY